MQMMRFPTLLAASGDNGVSRAAGEVRYQLAWPQQFDDPRFFWLGLFVVLVLAIAFVVSMYRRDAAELRGTIRSLLTVLRLIAVAGVLVFALGLEKRTQQEVVFGSRVVMLVDVSQSMGFTDSGSDSPSSGTDAAATTSRLEEVITALANSPLLAQLLEQHDVEVVAFDTETRPIAALPRRATVEEVPPDDDESFNWNDHLLPSGAETRLGEAMLAALRENPAAPLASLVILSDGASNAGTEPVAAADLAADQKIPVHTVGFGSTRPKKNVRLANLVAPVRAYPGDELAITAHLQARGYEGWTVDVELSRRAAEDPSSASVPLASQSVVLGSDDESVPVTFQMAPTDTGAFTYRLNVRVPTDDSNASDHSREADIEIVDRQLKVLLFAGGPTRDFRFLRNQLHRDKSVIVDVWLQSSAAGSSQDANQLLQQFPSSKESLFEYDCIIAFDPDWTQLRPDEVDLLETWVGNEAGGLIAIAGSVHTEQLVRSAAHAKIRGLYPVEFQQRLSLLDDGRYGAQEAWPIEFTEEGRQADFLWLRDTPDESRDAWARFPGVYGYFDVKGPKPGATVYARFSDPDVGLTEDRPVLIAGQFYGAGRTFFLGSGEFWRLRGVDPGMFEVFYTKLLRHVSQGRLLRGSSLGALIANRDRYQLGNTVALQAQLSTLQHEPLVQPQVNGQVLRPDQTVEPLLLHAEQERPGQYTAEFVALQPGVYRVDVPIPGAIDQQLTRRIHVEVPQLESEHPQRDEGVLGAIARRTGGKYFANWRNAIGDENDLPRLAAAIPDRSEIQMLEGAPDRSFALAQSRWLLGGIGGALLLEWLIRRLCRLA